MLLTYVGMVLVFDVRYTKQTLGINATPYVSDCALFALIPLILWMDGWVRAFFSTGLITITCQSGKSKHQKKKKKKNTQNIES